MIGTSLPGVITCKAICFSLCCKLLHFFLLLVLDPIQNTQVQSHGSNEEVYLKFFRPSSECRNITDYQVRLCNMTSLLESSFNQSDTEIWINVKGLKTDDHCVDVTAIGSAGFTRRRIHVNISAGRDCEVSVSDATNLVPIIVPIVVVVLVVAAVGGGYGGYKYNQRKKGAKAASGNKSGSDKKSCGKKELDGAVISLGGDKSAMQDSRAYVLPFVTYPCSDASEGIAMKDSSAYASLHPHPS
eukprot:m.189045 g.189045  ORF g.189045 m.189045 type:complete len:243 (+) comp39401_c0_seq8:1557-2285(+)